MKSLLTSILVVISLFVSAQEIYTIQYYYIPWDVKFRDAYTVDDLKNGIGVSIYLDTISKECVDSIVNTLNNLKPIRAISYIDVRMYVLVRLGSEEIISIQINRDKMIYYQNSLYHKDVYILNLIEHIPQADRKYWDRKK